MKNVKIISNEYLIYFPGVQESKFISYVNYFLRLYYELNSKDNTQFNWLAPKVLIFKPEIGLTQEFLDNFCQLLIDESVDVLGFSVYVWNRDYFKKIGNEVKKRLPHITIVGGGPDLDAHKDPNFFQKEPFYDYVIYGDGEKGFTDLLDNLAGFQVDLTNIVDRTGKIYPHEVFTDKNVLNQSPYIRYKDEIIKITEELRVEYQKLFDKKPHLIGVWETTKGCPYSCSFCDWSSGLHNKVRFWHNKEELLKDSTARPNYELELELFADVRLDMLQWSNPNVGLSPSDSSIVDYWCNLSKTNINTPKSFILQLSKIKKEQAHKLYRKMIIAGLEDRLKFDLQDLDPVVIENLDRPEIPWPEHKKMIQEMIDEFPEVSKGFKSKMNFIWGLPGQTLKHYDYNLTESLSLGLQPYFFYFEMLPNAPASDPAYIEKYKLNIERLYVCHMQIPPSVTEISEEVLQKYFSETNLITGSYSMTQKEWYTGIVKNYVYRYFFIRQNAGLPVDKFLNNFHHYDDLVDEMYEDFLKNKLIAVHPGHLINSGLGTKFKNKIIQITKPLLV